MAKAKEAEAVTTDEDVNTSSEVKKVTEVEEKPVAKRARKTKAKVDNTGFTIFKNLTEVDIDIFNHKIPAKGEKRILSQIGTIMSETPIVQNLVRIGRLKVI